MAAIPGYPPNTLFRTLAWDKFGVFMCGSHVGCSKGFSKLAHMNGRVDRAGTIHWNHADMRATKRGVRNLMKLMALVMNRSYWDEPRWKRLYLVNVWAFRHTKLNFHFLVRAKWSHKDRVQAYEWARKARKKPGSLRWKHRNFYKWLLDGGIVGGKQVNYVNREVSD